MGAKYRPVLKYDNHCFPERDALTTVRVQIL
jgi:hypothetical protein